MYYIGIDIGSTSAKTIVLSDDAPGIVFQSVMPTGWSSIETSKMILSSLVDEGISMDDARVVATGYGRISVPFAHKTITEISCHGRGASWLFPQDCTVIDIGGQDTKIIVMKNGQVSDFLMNDKCSAGTGRFLEIMANSLGVTLEEIFVLASNGSGASINSTCTVFAESEVISMIGSGRSKEDIAFGILESITNKVVSICSKKTKNDVYFLTGGLCDSEYIRQILSKKLSGPVHSVPLVRWAGAIGAALYAKGLS
jgi:predicted CoA-substrate-specific enzyme activase